MRWPVRPVLLSLLCFFIFHPSTQLFASGAPPSETEAPPAPSTVPNFVGKINFQDIAGQTAYGSSFTINYSWDPATASGGINRYQIVFQPTDGSGWMHSPHVMAPATSYTMQVSGLADRMSYSIHIRARDNAGVWGSFVSGGSFTVDHGPDNVPPPIVPNFEGRINGQLINGQTITIDNPTINYTWDHVTDISGIERFQVVFQQVNVAWIQSPHVLAPNTSLTMTTSNLIHGESYSIHIRAKDGAGNWGSFVLGGQFTVDLNPDVTPPSTVPQPIVLINGQIANGQTVSVTNPTLEWSWGHAIDPSGIDRYHLVVQPHGGPFLYSVNVFYPNQTYTMNTSGLVDGTSYSMHIRARDNAGNWSNYQNEGSFHINLNPGDVTPPTAPPNFVGRINGQNISGLTIDHDNPLINFTWNQSTDNVGVEKYRIKFFLNDGSLTPLYAPEINHPTTSYNLQTSNLQDGEDYYVYIEAEDAAGNLSSISSGGIFLVDLAGGPDVIPPSAVPNFSATINGQSIVGLTVGVTNPTINYNWNVATDDDSGVDYYQVVVSRVGGGPVWINNVNHPTTTYTRTYSGFQDNNSYSVAIRAFDNAGNMGPQTVLGQFTVDLSPPCANCWSNPANWGGTLPGPNTPVTIQPGDQIIIDQNVDVKNITVKGELYVQQDKNIHVQANWILVDGQNALFEWGNSNSPYAMQGLITLKHDLTDTKGCCGTKFFSAVNGGTVRFFGAQKLSWTQLNGTVNPGATQLTLADPVDWLPGDEIVIASTDYDPHQAETRFIQSVNGNTVTLTQGLSHKHYGQVHNYDNGNESLDMRAEVGLLTRHIKIQGDGQSTNNGFGGHCMWHQGTFVTFDGVELYHMGQKSELGRYPFHWHLAGNVPGQHIQNSSIHRSWNRLVTVHGTNLADVIDNVGYDHIGHGYFLEDGTEFGNDFIHNLGILTRKPVEGEEVRPHDLVVDEVSEGGQGRTMLPATFWITHPNNRFVDNTCGGSEGSGFWMVFAPKTNPMGQFDGNTSHSTDFSNFSLDGRINANQELDFGHYRPRNGSAQSIPIVRNFTGYKCRERNVWMRANTMHFIDCSLADSPRNTFFAYNQILKSSLLVGKSPNTGEPQTANEIAAGRSLPRPDDSATHQWNILSGHTIYDGPSGLEDVHFAEFSGNDATCFNTNAAAVKSSVHFVEGLTFEPNILPANKVDFGKATNAETMYAGGVIDRDGSLTGTVGATLMPRIEPHPTNPRISEDGYNREPGATLRSDWDAFICPDEHYGILRLMHQWDPQGLPPYNIRSDGPAAYGHLLNRFGQPPVIVNDNNLMYYTQHHTIPNHTDVQLRFIDPGDNVIAAFPNMPSDAKVYRSSGQPLAQATSLNNLRNSTTQKYWFRNNTIYIKLFGIDLGEDWQHGNDFRAQSDVTKVCLFNNCDFEDQFRTDVPFADFEMGLDTRLQPGGSLGAPTLTYDSPGPATGPTNGIDNKVSWSITTDGDAVDECVQVKINTPRQIWNEFQYVYVKFLGSPFRLAVRDKTHGWKHLGVFQPGNSVEIPLNPSVNGQYLDEIECVRIRIRESDIGTVGVPGTTANVDLHDITLSTTQLGGKGGMSEGGKKTNWFDQESQQALEVFPNPNTGEFSLSMDFAEAAKIDVMIVDLQGRKVMEFTEEVSAGQWQKALDMRDLDAANGLYKVILRSDNGQRYSASLMLQ